MSDACFDELELDGADAAVVHVGGSDAVGACCGVCHCDVGDAVDGESVVQAAIFAQNAAVAVGGVFAETHVCDDEKVWKCAAEESNSADDGTLGVVCTRSQGVFCAGGNGDTEEDNGFEALVYEGCEVGDKSVETAAVLVGKRGDEGFFVGLVGDEERVDEHRLWDRVSAMFVANHSPLRLR